MLLRKRAEKSSRITMSNFCFKLGFSIKQKDAGLTLNTFGYHKVQIAKAMTILPILVPNIGTDSLLLLVIMAAVYLHDVDC